MNSVKDLCAICNQDALKELYSGSFDVHEGNQNADLDAIDYKCTSMSHHIKPMIARCGYCKMVQIPRSQQPINLLQTYADVVDEDYLNNFQVKKRTFSHAYQKIKKYLPKNGNLLEIGSYCGLFLGEALNDGLHCTGIEPSTWAANYAQVHLKNCKIYNLPMEEAIKDFKDQFDVVVSWDVIEHVQDPLKMMKEVFTLLKKDGYFIFSTIIIDSQIAKLMGKKWHWIMDMHLYYFSAESLQYLFKESGFKLIEEQGYRHYASMKYAYSKLCFCFPESIAKMMMKLNCLVPNIVLPFNLGDVKYFVLKKIE